MNIIKARYWVILIFLIVGVLGFYLTELKIQNEVQNLEIESESVVTQITLTWIYASVEFFIWFGFYLLIMTFTATLGWIISRVYANKELRIGFRAMSILCWTVVLFISGYLVIMPLIY